MWTGVNNSGKAPPYVMNNVAMLFKLILCRMSRLFSRRSWLRPRQGTPGGSHPSLSPSLFPFIPPSSVSVSSGLASGLCSQVSFNLNPLFNSFHLFDFIHLSFSLNTYLSLWLSGVLPPSLYLSLSIAGSVCRSPVSVRPSIRPCMCLSVCLSVRQGRPTALEEDAATLTSCVAGGLESDPA